MHGVCLVGTSSLFANPLSNSAFPVCNIYHFCFIVVFSLVKFRRICKEMFEGTDSVFNTKSVSSNISS